MVTDSGKLVSSTSVEHVICDDYLQEDTWKQIDEFNRKLAEALSDENFQVEGDGSFNGMYLDDIEFPEDDNPGVVRDGDMTPSEEEYGDMVMEERPEHDDKEAIDKYLNVKLIMDVGTNNECHRHVIKRSWGLKGEPIG